MAEPRPPERLRLLGIKPYPIATPLSGNRQYQSLTRRIPEQRASKIIPNFCETRGRPQSTYYFHRHDTTLYRII